MTYFLIISIILFLFIPPPSGNPVLKAWVHNCGRISLRARVFTQIDLLSRAFTPDFGVRKNTLPISKPYFLVMVLDICDRNSSPASEIVAIPQATINKRLISALSGNSGSGFEVQTSFATDKNSNNGS